MKKLIILVLLINTINLSAQEMLGFGKLKLYSSIDSLTKNNNIDSINNSEEYLNIVYLNDQLKTNIFELISDTISGVKVSPHGKFNKDVRVFYVRNFEIFNDIILKNIYLTFFNNILVQISCDDNTKLDDALKLKYGDPEIRKIEKVEKYGIRTSYYSQYKTNNSNLKCDSYLTVYYDKNYDKKYFDNITLLDSDKNDSINTIESLYDERIQKRINDKKLQSLNDF